MVTFAIDTHPRLVQVEANARPATDAPTRREIGLMLRDVMATDNLDRMSAASVVLDRLLDKGFRDHLFALYVLDGMQLDARYIATAIRDGAPLGGADAVPPTPAPLSEPNGTKPAHVEDAEKPARPVAIPNKPFNPDRATGIGLQAMLNPPKMTGILAFPYTVSRGREKPLGLLTKDEARAQYERAGTYARPHLQTRRFFRRLLDGMKDDQLVYQAWPDAATLQKQYDLSDFNEKEIPA